ncbi:MAG TPA: RecX family transcriptional regulator [Candidatus Saccharibacteria bacterium]|jgi:regulatory protein|nr:RecX family transcriptional regulator [Candidatus Saccharibacteria bacterium]HMT56076.1 RecX family transcriptional regulator [Candidatus Saccharibacteria bacterium]
MDGKYVCSLTLDQLLAEKLKKGLEVDDAMLARYKKLSEEGKVRARTLEWILSRPHSERELREYLFRKKVELDFVNALVGECIEKKYLDEVRYAEWSYEKGKRKHKSERILKQELKSQGVTDETIQNIVTNNDENLNESKVLKELLNKLRKRSRYADQTRLIRYLLSKGFRYELIKEALNDGE